MVVPTSGDEAQRVCALDTCQKLFTPGRRDQRYHDENCKTAAWRKRVAEKKKQHRVLLALPPPAGPASPPAAPLPVAAPIPHPPRAPRKVLAQQIQRARRARGLQPLRLDQVLQLLAQQQCLRIALRKLRDLLRQPDVQQALARLSKEELRALDGMLSMEELSEAQLDELLDERLCRVGLAATRIDEDHVAVAVFAAGQAA